MKKFNRTTMFIVAMFATALLFLFGEKSGSEGATLATLGVIAISDADKAGLNDVELKMVSAVEKLAGQIHQKISEKAVSKEEVTAMLTGFKDALKSDEIKQLNDSLEKIKEASQKQGVSLSQIETKISTSAGKGFKPIAEVLEAHKEELQRVYNQGSGSAKFMVNINEKGEFVMRPYTDKAAGPHATVADVGGGGNVASVTHDISASTILRLGGNNAQIVSQYRNSPFLFDLVNVTNAGWSNPFAVWFEEQARQGTPATVAEGVTKPLIQYAYKLKSSEYRKAAALIGVTDEFNLDFARLQSDIMGKGKMDVMQVMNDDILGRIKSAATAYNSSVSFGSVAMVNDFDVIAAMAAQVDSATYGGVSANAALMSTFKKYKMGITKSEEGSYLNPPAILNSIALIGNPAMATDDVIVGDMKACNVILRSGFMVKIGYNGTDFAENRFSIVMEQYYFDYIPDIKKVGIVKGPDFATVKSAIGDGV